MKLKAAITQAELYEANPALIQRQIEQAINRELSCLFDLAGGAIQKSVLDPNQLPPGAKYLVRKSLKPRYSFKFNRTSSNTGFFGAWKKQLEDLIVDFAKQMLLSILKDVVKAALGCSPDQPEEEMGQTSRGSERS